MGCTVSALNSCCGRCGSTHLVMDVETRKIRCSLCGGPLVMRAITVDVRASTKPPSNSVEFPAEPNGTTTNIRGDVNRKGWIQ